jgi:hypothetical protein
VTFTQKTQISEEDVKLASGKLSGFIPSKWLMGPEIAKICQTLKAGEIVQYRTAL